MNRLWIGDSPAVVEGGAAGDLHAPVVNAPNWVRNSEWLAMPAMVEGVQSFAGLFAIIEKGTNDVRFNIAGDYTVDWGDGGALENVTGTASRTYDYATFDVPADTLTSLGYKQALITVTMQAGQNLTSLNINLKSPGVSGAHTSQWLDISINSLSLTYLTIGWTLIKHGMLERVQVGEIGTITTMHNKFLDCTALQSISLFDTASANTFESAFANCYLLQEVPAFDCQSSLSMTNAFSYCGSLVSATLLNTGSATNWTSTFNFCRSLTEVDVDIASATTMATCFQNCQTLRDVSSLDFAGVTTATSCFAGCSSLTNLPTFVGFSPTTITSMFQNCQSLREVPLFDTSGVSSFNSLFSGCHALESVPNFLTAACTNMASTFNACRSLSVAPVLNTSLVNTFASCFGVCAALKLVPDWDYSAATTIQSAFSSCQALRCELPALVLTACTNASYAFQSSGITWFPPITAPLLVTMTNMFTTCQSLVRVPSINSTPTSMASFSQTCNLCVEVGTINLASITAFNNLFSLPSLVRFQGTGIKYTMTFQNANLSQEALVEIFTNLGTAEVGGTRTITVTGNPGAAGLTALEQAICTDKGFQLSL
jgi:hypothetical protein